MNINRHNYETFFLLYIDKELSAAEVKAVDVFVNANPDLKEELLMLQQTILTPDEINTDLKAALLKEEGVTALQEKLLLFIDNELNAADKNNLQLQLQKDVVAATELNILQQTKLLPDTNIVFADKQSLYRREPAKVVGIKWWRIAAAAVLLGFGIWGAIGIYNKQHTKTGDSSELAKNNNVKKETITVPVKKEDSGITAPSNIATPQTTDVQNTATVKIPKENNVLPGAQKVTAPQQAKTIKDKAQDEKENMAVANGNKKETNNLPTPLENFNSIQRNKNNASFVQPIESNNAKVPQDIALVKSRTTEELKGITLTEPTNPDAKTAVYKEGDNDAVAMQGQQTKHSKFGGFLRKVKRVIERTTNIKTGDDDVIKVAGFDIAIK